MRSRLRTLAAGFACCGLTLAGCDSPAPSPVPSVSSAPPQPISGPTQEQHSQAPTPPSPIQFKQLGPSSGIDLVYFGGPSEARHMTEQNGGGIGCLDYDRDGGLDLFFSNGAYPGVEPPGPPHSQRIYRNLCEGSAFQDVTLLSGLEAYGLGQGVAAGDFDNDGFPDLYVAAYGRSRLWRNNGDGTFSETTDDAGVANDQWASSPAWADLNNDGLLDLYVVNYVTWSPSDPPCSLPYTPPVRISCPPTGQRGQPDRLYQNLGDGRFTDIGQTAGIAVPDTAKGLAVGIADFNDDDRLDVYVANDTTANSLFINSESGQFTDEAILRGVAVSGDGTAGSSMGVAIGDYDNNSRFDIAVTNFLHQPNDLYQNLGEAGFLPTNSEVGLDLVSRPMLKFGIALSDFDADGWADLFIANGHIWDLERPELAYKYRMRQQVVRNEAGAAFRDLGVAAGDYFGGEHLGRAVAIGDLNDDGLPDVIVGHLDEPPALLHNQSQPATPAARIQLVGRRSARDPRGIRIDWQIGDRWLSTTVPAGGSFQVTHAPRLTLASLGQSELTTIRVHWGPGQVETWSDIPAGRLTTLVEGDGAP
jgi:hypothetical protein